jgi:hypothetical protein
MSLQRIDVKKRYGCESTQQQVFKAVAEKSKMGFQLYE